MENKLLLAIVIIGSLLVASCGIPIWFTKVPLALKLFVSLFAVGGSVFVALIGFYFLGE